MENTGGRVAVIGAGASGCMAAIAAAQAGCSVTLFEKNEKIARKIYATGNGRCNLTNFFLDESCYHTHDSQNEISRVLSFIEKFSQEDLIRFFKEAGVPVHDRGGYVYPRTDQAETVARALEKCLRRERVEVCTDCQVEQIEKTQDGFCIRYLLSEKEKGKAQGRGKNTAKQTGKNAVKKTVHSCCCDAVILCTGGLAGPSFGCSGDGYRMAEHFSHTVISPLPALTRLETEDPFLRRAAGVRCHASVTLLREADQSDQPGRGCHPDRNICEDGELQITENSLSGIPIFQISGTAAGLLSQGRRVRVLVDFLPEFTRQEYEKEMQERLVQDRGQMLGDFLLGLAHRKVIDMILARAGLQAEMKARRLTDGELRGIMETLRALELEVTATGGFEHAQVTKGGVPLSEIADSFASRKEAGLFLAGELLDVDGRCGGYNLQWAMTSGLIAGRSAAGYLHFDKR